MVFHPSDLVIPRMGITFFATSEIPLYQHLTRDANWITKQQFTAGVNYRFLTKECEPEFELEK